MATAPTPTAAKPSTIDSTGQTQVSFTNYNARGEDYSDIDQAGIETRTIYDDDGRTASVIQNYQDGGNLTPATASDQNLTTLYLYASGSGVSSVSQVEANTSSSLIDVTATTGTALDGGSGTFLMYSANTSDTSQSDQTSEGSSGVSSASANVVAVRYVNGSGWQYCQGVSWSVVVVGGQQEAVPEDIWTPFTPRPDDVLIASVEASTEGSTATYLTGSNLTGQPEFFHGIQYGYASSADLLIIYIGPLTGYSDSPEDTNIDGYTPAEFQVTGSIVPDALAQVTSYIYGALPSDDFQRVHADRCRARWSTPTAPSTRKPMSSRAPIA